MPRGEVSWERATEAETRSRNRSSSTEINDWELGVKIASWKEFFCIPSDIQAGSRYLVWLSSLETAGSLYDFKQSLFMY